MELEEEDLTGNRYWAPYDHRMCFELALGLSPLDEILERYNVTPTELKKLMALPTFKEQVIAYKREIKDKGLSFREKAKIMAEDLLGTAYDLIHHVGTPPPVKSELIRWVAKMAALEPGPQPAEGASQSLLPAIEARLKAIPDSELEIQVTRIVQRRTSQAQEHLVEGEVVTLQ